MNLNSYSWLLIFHKVFVSTNANENIIIVMLLFLTLLQTNNQLFLKNAIHLDRVVIRIIFWSINVYNGLKQIGHSISNRLREPLWEIYIKYM